MPDTPEDGGIRGRIFESLGEDLAWEDGYLKLLSWLDKHYRQDKKTLSLLTVSSSS